MTGRRAWKTGVRMARAAASGALAVTVAASCARKAAPSGDHAWIVVEAAREADVDLATARVTGHGIVSAAISGSRLVIDVDPERANGDVVIDATGGCPLAVSGRDVKDGSTVRKTIAPLFDFGPPRAQVGFDAPFDIEARPQCAEAEKLHLAWTPWTPPASGRAPSATAHDVGGTREHPTNEPRALLAGAPLRDVRVSADGRKFHARTERLEDAFGGPLPWGVVPLSPRTRAETDIDVSATGTDGRARHFSVRVSAAARARGLPNVALGTRLYLGGDGFRVVGAPEGANAAVENDGDHAALVPDARGKWTLVDGHGRLLRLVAGKYDETPLDCGRSDCHAGISDVARTSPMATVLERGLDSHFSGDYPACALECHAEGEPGVDDGGFNAMLAELGRTPADLARTGFHDLPSALRRLGGVGCLGCHGPGAIPEESARYAILSAHVCEHCHDAPPRYGHATAWRTSRMARADADPRVTADRECARCHTTWGFLGRPERRSPGGSEPIGIACAACHAVHPESPDRAIAAGTTCADALVRDVPVPALLGSIDGRANRSRVCLGCHAPAANGGFPAATAAAIWAARGGSDPRTGASLDGPAPHAIVAGGCIGCHGAGPAGLERGAGHAFGVVPAACTPCHAAGRRDPSLRTRAEALWASLGGTPSRPSHAVRPPIDLTTARGRAAYDVALVLEDPAADVHGGAYARRLLDAAESALRDSNAPASPNRGGAR